MGDECEVCCDAVCGNACLALCKGVAACNHARKHTLLFNFPKGGEFEGKAITLTLTEKYASCGKGGNPESFFKKLQDHAEKKRIPRSEVGKGGKAGQLCGEICGSLGPV